MQIFALNLRNELLPVAKAALAQTGQAAALISDVSRHIPEAAADDPAATGEGCSDVLLNLGPEKAPTHRASEDRGSIRNGEPAHLMLGHNEVG
jgi:hypothetical protein